MALRTAPCFEFSIQAMVQDYHVYQDEWDAGIGEVLQCRRETGNRHDPYVVASLSDGKMSPLHRYHEKFRLFAQSLFDEVALSHVQLVTVDIILQTS